MKLSEIPEVKVYVKELEDKVKQEFIDVLMNNVINPYKTDQVLLGNDFVFVYVGSKRFKYTIRLKFMVYRKKGFLMARYYNLSIGAVYVSVKI
jgi:hypothetical protein